MEKYIQGEIVMASTQTISETRVISLIKDIKNPSFTPQQKPTEKSGKSLLEQIEDELSGDRTPRVI